MISIITYPRARKLRPVALQDAQAREYALEKHALGRARRLLLGIARAAAIGSDRSK